MKEFIKFTITGFLISLMGAGALIIIGFGIFCLTELSTLSGWSVIVVFICTMTLIAMGMLVLYGVGAMINAKD